MIDPSGDVPTAWQQPATSKDLKVAAQHFLAVVEPEASGQRLTTMYRMLKTKDYSRAELLLAMHELPFQNNYGQGFRLDLVEKIIQENREDRAALARPVSSEERDRLIVRYPKCVDPDGFKCCGFYSDNRPKWIYVPAANADASGRPPTPTLEEKSQPRRNHSSASSPRRLNDFIQTPDN